MTLVVGLCGDAGSGKDAVGTIIEDYFANSVLRFSFAQPVYDLAAAILGTTPDQLATRSTKETTQAYFITARNLEHANDVYNSYGLDKYANFPDVYHEFFSEIEPFIQPYTLAFEPDDTMYTLHISPRKMLELVGTELGRKLVHQDVWIQRIRDSIVKNKPRLVLITDVRFANEVEYVRESGYLIKVESPNNKYKIVSNHASNQGISAEDCDMVFVNHMTGLDILKSSVEGTLCEYLSNML